MGKKISNEEKYKIVRQILCGGMSERYVAKIMGVHPSSVEAWIRLYESEGSAALERSGRNRGYSAEIKQAAVEEYLAGKGSLNTVCKKYHIRASVTLEDSERMPGERQGLRRDSAEIPGQLPTGADLDAAL